ncbi:cytochrome c oxidase subunit I+III [Rhodoligotrophos appendicifer]|uniref:cytochrome c oxidase subunit I n=1 Tax=Rhodoligotrophos appendicifer TaxID=987056 RepID=UPI00117EBE15|nr:cytochrome c oxidase subunit I [Rhodoligotrophos appendicifer]
MNNSPETQTSALRLHRALDAIWGSGSGLQRLSAVNHNIVGKRFMLTALVFFAIGGLLAMLIRTQLASSSSAFMDADLYAQVFTMHGVVMMFLFAIPFFEGLAIYLLPKLLGARDLAFPRLTAYGYWCYLFGGTMLIVALLCGAAPRGGWFMYTPLSSLPFSPGIDADVWLLGITFVEISAMSAAVEIMVTVLKLRAPGMSLDRMPIFAWYMLVVAAMMLVGFPPLILGSILLESERAFGLPFFDPERGGDPLLWQHLFWLFGHPEVYIIFLPAAGVISTILPVFAGRPLDGYRIIVAAIVAMAFLSFGLWVHHMYTVGIPHVALSFFSAASALVAIPTAIQIFAWIGTLAHGRPRLNVPMLYVFGFFFVFILGGLTGVMLAMVPFDVQAHDTQFVVAHLHYVLVGGFLFPMLAGAYYWIPHITGKQPGQHLSSVAFWMIFVGFNVTFFIMHLTGLQGMPRRIYAYEAFPVWEAFNFISSLGSFIMAMGFALVAIDIALQVLFGRAFRRNPWAAGTLEWAMPTPPPPYNFASLPAITERADRLEPQTLALSLATGQGYLGFTRNGWMETLGVNMVTGEPDQVVVLPRQTFLPLWTALATGAVFLALLFKVYWLVPIAGLLTLASFLLWTRDTGLREDAAALPIGRGLSAPHHQAAANPPSLWALIFTLAADATLYTSLVFGAFFLWISAPNWPPQNLADTGYLVPVVAACSLILAAIAGRLSLRGEAMPWLVIAPAAQGIATLALAWQLTVVLPDPTVHAAAAAIYAVTAYAALHAALGLVFAGYALVRWKNGFVSQQRSLDLRLASLWHDYTAVAGVIALLFPTALLHLAGAGS